jgi:hypothetical protein
MSLQDPDLKRPVTQGDVRTLVLPSGGTIEIPLPNSKSRKIAINPPSPMLRGPEGGSIILPVIIGIAIGAAVGGAVVYWALNRQ